MEARSHPPSPASLRSAASLGDIEEMHTGWPIDPRPHEDDEQDDPAPPLPPAVLYLCRAASERIAAAVAGRGEPEASHVSVDAGRGEIYLAACWRDWQEHGPGFGDVQVERHSAEVGLSALRAIAPALRDVPLPEEQFVLWLSDEVDAWWETVRGYRA
jgi:hypothetical protein